MKSAYEAKKIKSIRPLHDHVLVTDMNFKERVTRSGIIIQSTDGKLEGIHARWGRVYAVGKDQKDVSPGQYILVKHGRWTRGTLIEDTSGEKTIRRIDGADILLVSDDPMLDETLGNGL
jgi:co-chaperonin GroES (HSP10)